MLKVAFRKIEKKDLALIMGWRNQERILKNSRDHRQLTMADQLKWFQKISTSQSDDMSLILENGVARGVCGLAHINRKNRSAEITYYLGQLKNAAIDVAMGSGAYAFLKKKGFEEYKLTNLYGEVFEYNEGGIKLAYYGGFKKKGIKRKSIFWNGKYWDGIMVSMTAEEYRKEMGKSKPRDHQKVSMAGRFKASSVGDIAS